MAKKGEKTNEKAVQIPNCRKTGVDRRRQGETRQGKKKTEKPK
jgi:hypothetical protein